MNTLACYGCKNLIMNKKFCERKKTSIEQIVKCPLANQRYVKKA